MKSKKFGIVCGIAIIIYLVFRFLLPLVVPFVIAGVVTLLLYPLLRKWWGNSKMWQGKRKKWLLCFFVGLFYVMLGAVICVIGTYLWNQGRSIFLNLPFYEARGMCFLKNCCGHVDVLLQMEEGTSMAYVQRQLNQLEQDITSGWMEGISVRSMHLASKLFDWIFAGMVTIVSTFFMVQDYEKIRDRLGKTSWGKCLCDGIRKGKSTLKTYCKAQGVICVLDGLLCSLAFLIVGQPYGVVIGLITALVDALPVFGASFVLLPFGVWYFIQKRIWQGVILVFAYLGCVCVRQITEPKMIGKQINIPPLFTIMSMYVGFRLFGVAGFLLGPLGVLIGKEVYNLISFSLAKEAL